MHALVLLFVALLSLCSSAQATIFYLSPSGLNTNAGTSAGAAWQTFAFALPRLFPGDTLTLVNGTYTVSNSGFPNLVCTGAHRNGTSAQPITIKAQNERQAWLQSNGTVHALQMNACSYWVIEGLHMSSTEASSTAGSDGSVMTIWGGSHHITVRRNIVRNNNRRFNSHIILLDQSHYNLFEENELYWGHRHGIAIFASSVGNVAGFNIFRRNYLNSRGYADTSPGYPSNPTNQGDAGISCYPCHDTIFENNISEGWSAAMDVQAKGNARLNRYLGNISLGNSYGLIMSARNDWGGGLDGMPRDNQVTNYLSYNNGVGFWTRGGKNNRCDNCTILGSTQGVVGDNEGDAPGDGSRTIYGSNMLLSGNSTSFYIINHSDALFNELDLFSNGAATPAIPHAYYTNVITSDPALGACRVYIPTGSPAKGTGVGGADIGANILYRYQDGVLTTSPLWNPTTGAFPCGAQVAGVNNIAGSSCYDVHQRLNVNYNGCTLPGAVVDTIETFRVSPTGTGTTCSAGAPCKPSSVWGKVGAGDTVEAADGIYTGDDSMIDPPTNLHGTSIAKITVKAINDGMVTINGQGARTPLMLDTNNHWTIEGIEFVSALYTTCYIYNSTGTLLKRSICRDASPTADSSILSVASATDTTFTDFIAFGTGRHACAFVDDTNTVALRGVCIKNGSAQTGQAVFYERSTNLLLGNIIASVDLDPGSSTDIKQVIGPGSYLGWAGSTTTNKILGSIAYVIQGQVTGTMTALIEGGLLPASIDTGDVITTITDNNLAIRRGTVSPPTGFAFSGGAPKSITTADHWTDSTVRLPGMQLTEGGDTATFNPGLLNRGESTQPVNSAWIRKQLDATGAPTATDLWPWIMEARLEAALIAAGRTRGLNGAGQMKLTTLLFSETDSTLTLPLVLVWDIQPVSHDEDVTLPASKVCVYDSSVPAILQTTYPTAIAVAIDNNPSAGTLSGTLSVIPTNGCSIYSDLSINNAGVAYTMGATSAALTEVESAAFTITSVGGTLPTERVLQIAK